MTAVGTPDIRPEDATVLRLLAASPAPLDVYTVATATGLGVGVAQDSCRRLAARGLLAESPGHLWSSTDLGTRGLVASYALRMPQAYTEERAALAARMFPASVSWRTRSALVAAVDGRSSAPWYEHPTIVAAQAAERQRCPALSLSASAATPTPVRPAEGGQSSELLPRRSGAISQPSPTLTIRGESSRTQPRLPTSGAVVGGAGTRPLSRAGRARAILAARHAPAVGG